MFFYFFVQIKFMTARNKIGDLLSKALLTVIKQNLKKYMKTVFPIWL